MLDHNFPTNKYDVKVARYHSRSRITVAAIAGFVAMAPVVLLMIFHASG
jgi:hypothetical protein